MMSDESNVLRDVGIALPFKKCIHMNGKKRSTPQAIIHRFAVNTVESPVKEKSISQIAFEIVPYIQLQLKLACSHVSE